jgi:transcription-repair coupling factor (superfamily II helicase)
MALRLDFFGDEIERCAASTPPTSARPTRPGLHPDAGVRSPARRGHASSASARATATFGATATGDPLYQAVSEGGGWPGWSIGCRCSRSKLATLFDHLGETTSSSATAGADGALDARREAIADYYANRERAMVVRAGQLPPARARARSISQGRNGGGASPSGRSTSPRPSPSRKRPVIDFGVEAARDFAPERAQQANVYEAVVKHVAKLARSGRRSCSPATPIGARERLPACSTTMA